VSLVDGETRRAIGPNNGFFHASIPGADRDAVLLLGIEPNLRWRTFAGLILDLAQDLGVEMVVTLGSLLADVPHTRPAPVTAAATDPTLVEQLGLEASRYEGPTGMVGIVHRQVPRGRHRVSQLVGGRAALTCRSHRARAQRSHSCVASAS